MRQRQADSAKTISLHHHIVGGDLKKESWFNATFIATITFFLGTASVFFFLGKMRGLLKCACSSTSAMSITVCRRCTPFFAAARKKTSQRSEITEGKLYA